ncbi:hypothetical protein QYE76_033431 [Lolium multiflorum]|uniref:Retrotransposon gag domain-containing protein n=1 Tax=Lolium multiflorum TaxID=4521 RepID=A0AAD8QVF6_LOLMU|nr:hypothetical protein QYE76_033431 [Lolium multiflorum]
MPATIDIIMPTPSLTLSGHSHHVYWSALTSLITLVHAKDTGSVGIRQNVTCSDAPTTPRTRPGRANTPPCPVDPNPLLSPTHAPRPSTSRTTPLDRRCPVDDDAVDAIRHCCQSARTMAIATDRHSLRRQVLRTHHDVAFPPASAPNPLDHCSAVVIDDLPRTPRACLDPINSTTPRLFQAHHSLLRSSVKLLEPSPFPISYHAAPISPPEAGDRRRASPNSSTPGAAATLPRLAVVASVICPRRHWEHPCIAVARPSRSLGLRRLAGEDASTEEYTEEEEVYFQEEEDHFDHYTNQGKLIFLQVTQMEYQWECYQLGHGGELKFEKDLKQLVEYLGHPYPEFFGTSFNNQLGGSPRWEVSADLGRKLEAPMAPPNRNANQDAMMQLLQTLMTDREDQRAERQANLAALQQIAQNNQGHGNHDHPGSKLKNFQNTNPPMFSKTEEPLDADDWLQTMENNLEVAGVEAAEKVLFATHYLSGPARAWWTSACAMNAGQMMNWEDFKLKFSKYHVPQGLIKKMRDEFRELKQGRMSVVEYRDRFLTLSRYAPDETDTNEKRKERFLNGLHDEMQTVLVNILFADLEAQ